MDFIQTYVAELQLSVFQRGTCSDETVASVATEDTLMVNGELLNVQVKASCLTPELLITPYRFDEAGLVTDLFTTSRAGVKINGVSFSTYKFNDMLKEYKKVHPAK
ncbi:MAG TPA: hypothetical protein EYH12_00060 [Psychromonas hadalis]|nr:hypothetical protein [Psychromonas hadalis]